jgi:hypothetical protein
MAQAPRVPPEECPESTCEKAGLTPDTRLIIIPALVQKPRTEEQQTLRVAATLAAASPAHRLRVLEARDGVATGPRCDAALAAAGEALGSTGDWPPVHAGDSRGCFRAHEATA